MKPTRNGSKPGKKKPLKDKQNFFSAVSGYNPRNILKLTPIHLKLVATQTNILHQLTKSLVRD